MGRKRTSPAGIASRLIGSCGWQPCRRQVQANLEFAPGLYQGPATLIAERSEDKRLDSPWSGVIVFRWQGKDHEVCITSHEIVKG